MAIQTAGVIRQVGGSQLQSGDECALSCRRWPPPNPAAVVSPERVREVVSVQVMAVTILSFISQPNWADLEAQFLAREMLASVILRLISVSFRSMFSIQWPLRAQI